MAKGSPTQKTNTIPKMPSTEKQFEDGVNDAGQAFESDIKTAIGKLSQSVLENGNTLIAKNKLLKSKNKALRLEKKQLEGKMGEMEAARAEAEKARDKSLKSFKLIQKKRNKELGKMLELQKTLAAYFEGARKRRRQANASNKEERLRIMATVRAHTPKKMKVGNSREQNIATCVESKEKAEAAAAGAAERLAAAKSKLRALKNAAKRPSSPSSSSSSSSDNDDESIEKAKTEVREEEEALDALNKQVESWDAKIKSFEEQEDAETSSSFSVSDMASTGYDDGASTGYDDGASSSVSSTDVDWDSFPMSSAASST